MKVQRLASGMYIAQQDGIEVDILKMDEPEYRGSGYYGMWIVQRGHHDYSEPVATYAEARNVAQQMLDRLLGKLAIA